MPRVEPTIDLESLFDQLEYKPHSDAQWQMHRSNARFRAACCGRRFGKSFAFGHEMTYKMFIPESVNWVVGPDYGLGEKEFRVVWTDFQKLGLMKYCNKSYNVKQGNMRIHFKEINSLLEVKSAERLDSLVGEGLDHVIMSEAAKHKRQTWEMYIRPALADKQGSADFPSTPQGFNWYEGLYQLGQNIEYPEFASWRFPTWLNEARFPGGFDSRCPNIEDDHHGKVYDCNCHEELIMTFNTVSPQFWLQEIAAEFTAFEGLIYDEFNEHIHVQQFDFNPAYEMWWALDFGFADPFICLEIMVDSQQRVWVWREYVKSYVSTIEHGLYLKGREYPPGYHVNAIAADPRGADEIATLAPIIGSIVANPQGNELGYESVKQAMKKRDDGLPGIIIHPRCVETIRSVKSIHATPGKPGYDVTRGQFDHPADALRYFFNERFVLGGGFHLADVYSGYGKTEAAGFFKYESSLVLSERFS